MGTCKPYAGARHFGFALGQCANGKAFPDSVSAVSALNQGRFSEFGFSTHIKDLDAHDC